MTPILTHQLARLQDLAPDQIEAGLMWLAGHDPEIFSATLDAARTWACDTPTEATNDWAPYCAVCGLPIEAAAAHDQGHAPVLGWHPVPLPR